MSGCPTSNARSFAKQSRKRLCRADCEAVERTSRNAAKWTQGTAKGWEGCLWVKQPFEFRNTFDFYVGRLLDEVKRSIIMAL